MDEDSALIKNTIAIAELAQLVNDHIKYCKEKELEDEKRRKDERLHAEKHIREHREEFSILVKKVDNLFFWKKFIRMMLLGTAAVTGYIFYYIEHVAKHIKWN